MEELRAKILDKIEERPNKHELLRLIFREIDKDASGEIDRMEFREMLRLLKLHYSDERFRRLFRAVDVAGDGTIEIDDFEALVFPDDPRGEKEMILLEELRRNGEIAGNNNSSAVDDQLAQITRMIDGGSPGTRSSPNSFGAVTRLGSKNMEGLRRLSSDARMASIGEQKSDDGEEEEPARANNVSPFHPGESDGSAEELRVSTNVPKFGNSQKSGRQNSWM